MIRVYVLATLLAVAVIALNVWYHLERRKLTPEERAREDEEDRMW